MAKALNQNRMRDSWIMGGIGVAVIALAEPLVSYGSAAHEMVEYFGYFLIAVAALGRVYASAFLGGHKNTSLIDYGPYSLMRNPLYFFSWLGFIGFGFLSGFITLVLLFGIGFYVLYDRLIAREEGRLTEIFGNTYTDYCKRVPRFFPNFSGHSMPHEVPLRPHYIVNAVKDAIWWFVPFVMFEGIEWLHVNNYVPNLITLP